MTTTTMMIITMSNTDILNFEVHKLLGMKWAQGGLKSHHSASWKCFTVDLSDKASFTRKYAMTLLNGSLISVSCTFISFT